MLCVVGEGYNIEAVEHYNESVHPRQKKGFLSSQLPRWTFSLGSEGHQHVHKVSQNKETQNGCLAGVSYFMTGMLAVPVAEASGGSHRTQCESSFSR